MFGAKKRRLLRDGTQAIAVVTHVEYAKLLGTMYEMRNYNYKLDLTLMVRPDDGSPFEAHVRDYFSQYAQPTVGDRFWVRYDPSDPTHVEIDQAHINADNAAVQASAAAAAASAPPADLAANGILGRALLVDVHTTALGDLVNCAVTVGVRLVDGTAPYRATCQVPLAPDQADRLVPGQTIMTVRADPNDHSRIALSLSEPTPVVTNSDPAAIAPLERALRDGEPCQVVILSHQRQWLSTPAGDEFYAAKVRVISDGSELQANLLVPPSSEALMQDGAELPARRLPTEPGVLAIDWVAAHA